MKPTLRTKNKLIKLIESLERVEIKVKELHTCKELKDFTEIYEIKKSLHSSKKSLQLELSLLTK